MKLNGSRIIVPTSSRTEKNPGVLNLYSFWLWYSSHTAITERKSFLSLQHSFATGLIIPVSSSSVHSLISSPHVLIPSSAKHGVISKHLHWAPSTPWRQTEREAGFGGMGWRWCWWGMEEKVWRTVFPRMSAPAHVHIDINTHTHRYWRTSPVYPLAHTPTATHYCCQSFPSSPPLRPLCGLIGVIICIRLSCLCYRQTHTRIYTHSWQVLISRIIEYGLTSVVPRRVYLYRISTPCVYLDK